MTSSDLHPDRRLPVLYLGFAHLSMIAATLSIALDPAAVAGFFYHPRLVATVHLVTLGWITASILGALYMLGPMVLRAPMPGRRSDHWAFWSYCVGVLGMVSHFWLDEPRGMPWSAGLVLLTLAWVGGRFLRSLQLSTLTGGAKIHFYLAFGNLLLAGTLGLLVGIDKYHEVLGGYVLNNVYAHAHLAALGWATMMVMGAGYRMLPMLLPAALPRGPAVWWSAILLEAGVLGLAASWLASRALTLVSVLCCLAGIALFLGRVTWMLGHRKPGHPKLARPDWGTLQSLNALLCLLVAAGLGLALALGPDGTWKLPAIMAYGVFGLLGFLAQIVVGIGARLLPLYAWLTAFGGRLLDQAPPSPHALAARPALAVIFGCWLVGVPGLAAGFAFDQMVLLRVAGLLLCLATVLNGYQLARTLRSLRGTIL